MDFRFCSDQHAIWDPRCNSRKLVQEGHWTRAAMLAMARNNNVQHCHLFPWCNVQRRNTYLAFCVPCQACDEPCRPADRDTWRLRLQPPPKEEPRHGRYLCLDPFLTVCTNGSPALHGREASQYSSVPSRACRPTFEMFPRPKHSELFSYLDHLNLRLGPNPTVTLRRLRPCFCSHRLTPLRLSSADTPPLALFQSYPS